MTEIAAICLITLISDVTPGPNFWKIVHYSVARNRADAITFATGLLSASLVHCLLGLAGVAAIISQFELGLTLIQALGGSYIAYYGLTMILRAKGKADADTENDGTYRRGRRKLWADGLLTNFANPKTILFYASLFAVALKPGQPPMYLFALVCCMLATSFCTNTAVACVFSLRPVQTVFRRWQAMISRVIGAMLIVAGLKIVFQQRG